MSTTTTTTLAYDYTTMAKGLLGFGHPVRLRAMILLETEHSPSEVTKLLQGVSTHAHFLREVGNGHGIAESAVKAAPQGPALGVVSYHVRMLRDYGLIHETRFEPKRGALEHFYQRTELGDYLMSHFGAMLGVPKRKRGSQAGRERELLALLATQTLRPEEVKKAA